MDNNNNNNIIIINNLTINDNINQIENNNERNSKLFYKCWKNIIIKKNIFSELEKYKHIYLKSSLQRFSFNNKTLLTFKYRDYLKIIHLKSSSYNYWDPFDIFLVNYKTGMVNAPTILCNETIEPGRIPEEVEKVIVQSPIIEPRSIPNTVSSLIINCKIDINQLELIPSSIKYLEIKYKITEPFTEFTFPNSIETLKLLYFNENLQPGHIPDSVKHLSLGSKFNQILRPGTFGENSKLNYIEFGADFNRPILINVLPKNLKTIIFGPSFKQPIRPNTIPNSVTSVVFRGSYDLPLDFLPKSIILFHNNNSFNKINQL